MSHEKATLSSYTFGFGMSLIITLLVFALVSSQTNSTSPMFSPAGITAAVIVLAVIQLFVQLVFFLHLGSESKPRWNLIATLFAIMVVLIVVIGSLWIMNNLDYHMMPEEMDQYMRKQVDKGF